MDIEGSKPFLDLETGEISVFPLIPNVETGENEILFTRRFQIPSIYYKPPQNTKIKPKGKLRKADPLESQLITAAIFLLPTMIFFHPILSLLVCITEIIIHNWFHKKNKTLEGKSVYFQSPLHGISKEMCGICKEDNAKVKIAKLQDISHDKFKNYIKRVVT